MTPLATLLHERTDAFPAVDILQPADPFLDAAGEDLRRRIFMTQDATGTPLCLRPEFTIPLCLFYNRAPTAGRFGYHGTVFRQAREGHAEFPQAGLEDLGHEATPERDAAAIADMMDAVEAAGVSHARLTLGDQALFQVVVDNLALPSATAARLTRAFGDPAQVEAAIDRLASPKEMNGDGATADLEALIARVATMMDEAGLSPTSGRTAQQIAERSLSRQEERRFRLPPEQADLLRAFLAIDCPLMEATERLRAFGDEAGLDFGPALDTFMLRADRLNESRATYRGSFGRKLEYYTGVVFEAHADGAEDAIAGGGRYDRLCSLLGSATPVPAIGFALYLDRLP